LSQFALDALGVFESFADALAALFKDVDDRFVGKFLQKKRDDRKRDALRQKQPPVEAEFFSRVAHHRAHAAAFSRCEEKNRGHKIVGIKKFKSTWFQKFASAQGAGNRR